LSSTDNNTFDLDTMGKAPYIRANLAVGGKHVVPITHITVHQYIYHFPLVAMY